MAEQRMRELGREGGVAWLAERLRRGDLERWRIELAAYCGDTEAREAFDSYEFRWCSDGCGANDRDSGCCHNAEDVLGEDDEGNQEHPPEHWVGKPYCGHCGGGWNPDYDADQRWDGWPPFEKWIRGLERWPGALLRAAIAAAEVAHPCPGCASDEHRMIAVAKTWLGGPSENVAEAAAELAGAWANGFMQPHEVAWAALGLGVKRLHRDGLHGGVIRASLEFAKLLGEQRVREAISARLTEWALA